MKYVKVKAPVHLHAGNMDLNGELGRVYGPLDLRSTTPASSSRWRSGMTSKPTISTLRGLPRPSLRHSELEALKYSSRSVFMLILG
ncbi:MAG: hypothetical protein QW535_00465 [Candidatus Nezhaarchaeales archaeon]